MMDNGYGTLLNPALFPEESKLDGRLDKILSLLHEYAGDMGEHGLSETIQTIFRPLTSGENIWEYKPNLEISEAVYKDAARFVCSTYATIRMIRSNLYLGEKEIHKTGKA